MPLLPAQNKIQILDFKCKLPADLIADVQAYASAIDSDVNYVVSRAIEKLTTDKDFQTWKERNADKLTTPNTISGKQKRGPKPKPNAAAA